MKKGDIVYIQGQWRGIVMAVRRPGWSGGGDTKIEVAVMEGINKPGTVLTYTESLIKTKRNHPTLN